MVKQAGVKLNFVILGACHSETAANIFLEAGAEHVIGISRDKQVLDDAALTFTQAFYQEVWKNGSKICKCFDIAKLQVKMCHGEEEAKKFLLRKSEEHQGRECHIYGNF